MPTQNPAPDSPSKVFRSDIEGLRAIACLLVAIHHIWLGQVSGGVDVFFVIAGFLITNMLLRQLSNHGRIISRQFLGRLGRRLLPASVTVIIATVILTFAFFPRTERLSVAEQSVASLFYFQNWFLAFNAVEYAGTDESRSPLQHFWAMSTQGQFYLIWLAIFLFAAMLIRKSRGNAQKILLSILAPASLVSFTYAVHSVTQAPAFAYFDTFARLWEFGVGAIVALLLPRLALSSPARAIITVFGIVAILSTGFIFTADAGFPGWPTLLPVAGAVAVLLGGTGPASEQSWPNRVLSLPPLVWLGGIAYGIYLWHWPLLITAQNILGVSRLGFRGGLIIIAASIILAWLTARIVEAPFKRNAQQQNASGGRRIAENSILVIGPLVIVGVSAFSVVQHQQEAESMRAELTAVLSSGEVCFGASAIVDYADCESHPSRGQVFPASDPKRDRHVLWNPECRTEVENVDFKLCSFGHPDAETRVLLIGNSHAAEWITPLLGGAERYEWSFDSYFKGACAFNAYPRRTGNELGEQSCQAWSSELVERLLQEEPYDYIITSANGHLASYFDDLDAEGLEVGVRGFHAVWDSLIAHGSTIVILRDYPRMDEAALECAFAADSSQSCGVTADWGLATQEEDTIWVAASGRDEVVFLDLSFAFCADGWCPSLAGDVIVYRDTGHTTFSFMNTVTPYFWTEFERVAGPLPVR